MIPKIIHFCWFGGKNISAEDKINIASWREKCPDYKIIMWSEKNYDVKRNKYMYDAYKKRKFGFVPDYARLDIIYLYGGFYFDTDVELLKSLDQFLNKNCVMGFENEKSVNHGHGFAAEPGNINIKKLMDEYNNRSFYNNDGTLNLTPSPVYITKYLVSIGLELNNKYQNVDGIDIYPSDYFCPKDYLSGKTKITKNTVSIHKFNMSWMSFEEISYINKMRFYSKFLGKKIARNICDFQNAFHGKGIKGLYLMMYAKIQRKTHKDKKNG